MPLTSTIDVDRAPEDVFDYVTDPGRFAEWQRGVVGGHADNEGRRGLGDRCVTTRRIGWMTRSVTSEVTDVEAPRRWSTRSVDGPIRATVRVDVDPLDDGKRSRVRIALDFTGHGIGRLLVPLAVVPQARREMPTNLQHLKRRLEHDAS